MNEKGKLGVYDPSFEIAFWLNEYSNIQPEYLENYADMLAGNQTMTSNLGFAEHDGVLIDDMYLTIWDFDAIMDATHPAKRYVMKKKEEKDLTQDISIGADERIGF